MFVKLVWCRIRYRHKFDRTPTLCSVELKFYGTDTDTDTDTDFLADFRARILARQSACRGAPGPFSSPTCPRTFVRRALFLARMSVGDARVYTCTCTVHDKRSCTRLQNYTIGASLKPESVSVPWNLSLYSQLDAEMIDLTVVFRNELFYSCDFCNIRQTVNSFLSSETAPLPSPLHSPMFLY